VTLSNRNPKLCPGLNTPVQFPEHMLDEIRPLQAYGRRFFLVSACFIENKKRK
jgi:hypothetical protein